jgi:hypothetical protein
VNASVPITKPLAKATPESRLPRSIRYSDSEWRAITEAAIARGVEPSRFARILSMTGLRVLPGIEAVEAYRRSAFAESA